MMRGAVDMGLPDSRRSLGRLVDREVDGHQSPNVPADLIMDQIKEYVAIRCDL